jgi:two-component system, NtrC family, sensor histidine kinase HydH
MDRKSIITSAALLIFLAGVVFLLSYRANKELQQVVTSQFNTQQLTLARTIARDIEAHFLLLETALNAYSSQTTDLDPKKKSDYFHQILKDWQVLALGMLCPENEGKVLVSSPSILSLGEAGIPIPEQILRDLYLSKSRSPVFFSRTIRPDSGPFKGRSLMALASPNNPPAGTTVPEESPEQTISFFIVDANEIAGRYAQGVVSGKTGYPWVIDEQGHFIYHVEKDFLGGDSLTVRRDRNPSISYQRINELTRKDLLQGKEGTDWYITGWHWDVIAEMKKLLAYSPVNFHSQSPPGPDGQVWSVGLAAPEAEVYGLIQPVVVRQLTVIGLFSAVVVSGLLILYLISLRWNKTLAGKVEEKTKYLVRSQKLLRREKEKVEKNMQALVEAQQKLIHSERFAAIGEAAAHLSHEIKNPLMLMSGFAAQVARKLPEKDPGRKKLEIISQEAKRLENMLNQVRDFTRPQLPRKKQGQINDLIRETADLVQDELDLVGVDMELNLTPGLPETNFDHSQIKQVMLNLLKNAWEALPGGGKITVATGVEQDRVVVSVEDTGVGISSDKMKQIFSPFFTTKDKGTGLGLAVLYRIIKDHQGDITVDSTPGRGSRFTFYLPLS